MFWTNLPMGRLLLGLVPHLGFLAVRAFRKARAGRLRPFVAGKVQALAGWRQVRRRRRELYCSPGAAGLHPTWPSQGAGVLRRGLVWLKRRECA